MPPGPLLPGYTFVRRLGSGGAADVYLARQDDLDREVAIKVLRRDLDDPKQWRRFQQEAHTVARLSSHPRVVTVYTAGRADSGQPYLVTEYLERGSLGEVLDVEGPLPPERAARVGVAVAEALLAAHELGILHRDVKPGNVLLGEDGRIKLGDFGIARLLEAQAVTVTDVIAFTPEHVAPEILRNEPDGTWSDVYGLASTVASAVLGRSPFQMGPEERLDAFLTRKVTSPPPQFPGWIPALLARPIAAALDPDPRRRPSLPELHRDLQAAAAGGSGVTSAPPVVVPAAPTPPTEQLVSPSEDGRLARHRVVDPGAGGAGGDRRNLVPAGEIRRQRAGRALAVGIAAAVFALAALVAATSGLFPSRSPEGAVPTTSAMTSPATVSGPITEVSAAAPGPSSSPVDPPSTSPPAQSDPASLTSADAETYVRSYYDAVAAGDYERTWAQLAPEFQTGTALSFDYYVGFWEENDIEVGDVELVRADAEGAVINAELRWNGNTDAVVSQFTLRAVDGTLLIADQETVSD